MCPHWRISCIMAVSTRCPPDAYVTALGEALSLLTADRGDPEVQSAAHDLLRQLARDRLRGLGGSSANLLRGY